MGRSSRRHAALIVVDAYKTLGFDASAERIRAYVAGLRNWAGVDGTYDFRRAPQRGVGASNVVMVEWLSSRRAWSAAVQPSR